MRRSSLFIALLCAGAVQASPVFIQNHGFEEWVAAPNTFPVGADKHPGWLPYNPDGINLNYSNVALGVLNPTGSTYFPGGAPEGNNVGLTWLDDGAVQSDFGLRQELGTNLQPNTHYTLQVEVGNIASGTGSGDFAIYGFFNLAGFPGYAVQLLAGGALLAEDNNSLGGLIGEGVFGTSLVEFTTGSSVTPGQALEIRLINLNNLGTAEAPGIEVDFDNVRLDATPVPLPASLWLFVSGLAAFRVSGKKRGRQLPE